MRIAVAEGFGAGQLQGLEQFKLPGFGFGPCHLAVIECALDDLLANPDGRVERGGGRLGYIGDLGTAHCLAVGATAFHQRNAAYVDGTADDAAAATAIAHGRQADSGLAGAGLANEAEHLAGGEVKINAIDQDGAIGGRDFEAADGQHLCDFLAHRSAPCVVPLILSNQSTTRLTPMVSRAMAAAGKRGA